LFDSKPFGQKFSIRVDRILFHKNIYKRKEEYIKELTRKEKEKELKKEIRNFSKLVRASQNPTTTYNIETLENGTGARSRQFDGVKTQQKR